MTEKLRITPVILSGGAGTRLWPLSRAAYPKQLMALVGEGSLLHQTAERVSDQSAFTSPLVLCNSEHRFLVAEQFAAAQYVPRRIVLEPVARNTAPAACVAALILAQEDPDSVMMLLPSDHYIADIGAFHAATAVAADAARSGWLVTFGIAPARPETGYGYIHKGEPLDGLDGCRVERFVEKPDRATAEDYLAAGDYLWNSGMFVFQAGRLLEEMESLCPELVAACRKALDHATEDLDFLRLSEPEFAASPSISLDYAVMEKTRHAAVVPVEFAWSDVGSWQTLWEIAEQDAAGNVLQGDVLAVDSRDSYLRSEGRLVAALGVQDLVVIATGDAVLVAPRSRTQDIRKVVEQLEAAGREEQIYHARVYRPWGSYQGVDADEGFQVKRLIINPGASISLQRHRHRAEHWVVVQGTAEVTRDDDVFILQVNESAYIPLGAVHRLRNPGTVPLYIVEVQSGDYLGEDDIERFEDIYGRS